MCESPNLWFCLLSKKDSCQKTMIRHLKHRSFMFFSWPENDLKKDSAEKSKIDLINKLFYRIFFINF